MTSSFPPLVTGSGPNARLNGWKEIASHFGRGVRTVQRWEKAFGMPVHSLGAGRGENVHAFADELDDWLRTARHTADLSDRPGDSDDAPSARGAPPAPGPDAVAPEPPAVPSRRRFVRRAWMALALIAGLAAAGAVLWHLSRPNPPSSAKVDGDTMRVYDADGRVLWSKAFKGPLPPEATTTYLGNGVQLLIADINGDGSREVLVFAPDADSQWPTRLFCFDAAGHELWTRSVSKSVRFGATDFRPSWTGFRLFTTGSGRNKALWSTWVHTESGLFPCLLERLSPATGRPLSEYWSAGYINTVKQFDIGGRPSILVGSNNNDHQAAGLAVFDADKVTGCAPAETEDKTCRNAPPGGPRMLLVFPRLEVTELDGMIPFVFDVRQSESGETFSVWVQQPTRIRDGGTTSYQLDGALWPVRGEIHSSYRAAHNAAEEAGEVKHPFGERDQAGLWPVLVHDGNRFVRVTGATAR